MPETIIRTMDRKQARKLEAVQASALDFVVENAQDPRDVVSIRHVPSVNDFSTDELVFELYERDAKGRVRAEDDPDHPDHARKPKTYTQTVTLTVPLPDWWNDIAVAVKKTP